MRTYGAIVAVFISFLVAERASSSKILHCPTDNSRWYGALVGNYIKDLESKPPTVLNVTRLKYSNLRTFCRRNVNGKVEDSSETYISKPSKNRIKIHPLPCVSTGRVSIMYCGLWESVAYIKKNVFSYEEPFRLHLRRRCDAEVCPRYDTFGPFVFHQRDKTEKSFIECDYQHSLQSVIVKTIETDAPSVDEPMKTPVILIPKSNLTTLKSSERLVLTCIDDSPVDWLLNGKPVESNGRVMTTHFSLGSQLLVSNVTSSDAGLYSCQTRRQTDSSDGGINISVAVEEEVVVPWTGVDLKCCFEDEREFPLRFQWLFKDRPVSHGRIQQTGKCSILHLARLKQVESGRYRCRVNFIPGPRFSTIPDDWLVWPWTKSYLYRDLTSFKVIRAERNQFAPSIGLSQSVKDGRIQVDLASSNGVITTVLVQDDDEDKYGPGRVATCDVRCNRWRCPEFSLLKRRPDGAIVGQIKVSDPVAVIDNLRLRIRCTDAGQAPRTATKEVVVSSCSHCVQGDPATTARLLGLLELDATQSTAVVHSLQNITTRPEALTSFQVKLSMTAASSALDSLSQVDDEKKMTVLEGATNVIGNCLRTNESVLEDGAKHIVETVTQLTAAIPLTENRTQVVLSDADLTVAATTVDRSAPGYVRFVVPPVQDDAAAVISNDDDLPASVAVSVKQSQVTGDRVDFSFFSSAKVFHTDHPGVSVISPVIAARADLLSATTADDVQSPEDEEPVQLIFNTTLHSTSSPECAFWNATTATWGGSGCSRNMEGQVVRCSCSHLTNFALIIRIDATSLAQSHQKALSHLSQALLIVSIAALGLTCYVYLSYMRQKQRDKRSGQRSVEASIQSSRTHICFSATLMIFLAFFLFTGGIRGPPTGCAAVGAVNHFLLLSVFSWSVVEGVQICSSIIHVAMQSGMVTHNVKMFSILSMTLGWGIPVILVALTLLVTNSNGYGVLDDVESFCFFKDTLTMYLAFLLPVCLSLLTNIIIISMLVYVLKYRMGLGNIKKKKQERSKRKLLGFFGVLVMLNVTWIVGLLNFGAAKVVVSYLFVILNGLQGFFVFLCYCIFQLEVRKHMRKSMICFKWMPDVDERSTSTSDARFLTETSQSVVYSSRKESIFLARRRMS